MTIHALILAGGRGSRLGLLRKKDIRIGGASLLFRAADRLREASAPLLVSMTSESTTGFDGGVMLPDMDLPIGGPIAGLVAAAEHLAAARRDDMLITVAVDTPFLPEDFVGRLAAALENGATAAYAGWGHNFYPTNAIWRLSELTDLPRRALRGDLPTSPRALLASVGAVAVDWSDTADEDPFVNLNTLKDLIALARRAELAGR